MNIFTYGTLMIPEVMYAVTTRMLRSKNAILRGYARFTVKGESYPGIIPATDAVTEGIIYFDVDELSLKRLDAFEGDLYRCTPVRVETEKEEMLNAETYVIRPEYRGYLSSKEWNVKEFVQKHLKAFLEIYSGFQKNS
ncbi:MAG: gamma-glutamylcyclotransferase [Desulfobacteraceae bacterium]|nr:gamma-glutamylcyclotransferase [Desulfobacteraceae bacterium]